MKQPAGKKKARALPDGWTPQHLALCASRQNPAVPVSVEEYLDVAETGTLGETIMSGRDDWFPPPLSADHPIRVGCGHRMLFRHWACVCGTQLSDVMTAWGIEPFRFDRNQRDELALQAGIYEHLERVVNRHRVDFARYSPPASVPTQREAAGLQRLIVQLTQIRTKAWARRFWMSTHFDESLDDIVAMLRMACRYASRTHKGPQVDQSLWLLRAWILNCLEGHGFRNKALHSVFGTVVQMATGIPMADPKKECATTRAWIAERP